MFFDIKQMQLGKLRFRETVPPGTIEFFDHQLRQAAPIESSGTAELMQSIMEIRVKGHLATQMEAACDRCLELTAFPIDADFDLFYRPASSMPPRTEVEIEDKEAEIDFYEGDGLELGDVLREQILLSLPMQRVCREDCKGICPVCGENRNQVDCGCYEELGDDRWSGLRNLQK